MAITVQPVTPEFAAEIGDVDLSAPLAPPDAKDVLDNLLNPALRPIKEKTEVEFAATRSDQVAVVGEIIDHVLRRILHDEVIIAVLFNRNPKIYYELGIAHSADAGKITSPTSWSFRKRPAAARCASSTSRTTMR